MITDPWLIEKRSFEIIESEIKSTVSEEHKAVIYRVIHTTADFEYAEITEIGSGAIDKGMSAIRSGCRIYCDTNMISAGVNKKLLAKYGCDIYTYIADREIADEAASRGVTRSIAGMERALKENDTKLFIIGNAPTALSVLTDGINSGRVDPSLVIGVPVGFVGAAESKDELKASGAPCIITRGRKGGSTVAVAIINAILLMMEK